ncbi:selenocysteine-specific elongation factor-like [Lytechinus variegatus]|uniref:selenocysteine-specific elongation factor-like n=1 Tax=Lytechinus variegatus TaxID=7654 RepID=UPI001BB218CF|nr:selenocysteine-specific elongation factor-like [Lytechinus variegatus]
MAGTKLLNFNVGVLGHVDSGKTSLAKALSTTASTAAFDKNPQSKERGITLDLGFSSFSVDVPDHISTSDYNKLQFTLVDCPGHASLIKTIIGGAQIIDLMMLVIDVTKGMQTQSAECLVIGQIACEKMFVVLNKVDLLPPEKKKQQIEKMTKRMLKTLEPTKFANCPVIAVAAKPGGPDAPDEGAEGIQTLIEELKRQTYIPKRDSSGPFLYSVDHCFGIRGQGTVMTGTVLSGKVNISDNVEVPSLQITRKVKSMQMFRKPVNTAIQGDRVALCVTQFDPKLLERGLVSAPGILPIITAAIVSVHRIPYFKGTCATKAKFHVTMGHETVMCKVSFFGPAPGHQYQPHDQASEFNFESEYLYEEELYTADRIKEEQNKENIPGAASEGDKESLPAQQWALLEFEKPVACPRNCLVIGSKLDTDIHANTCRLAFHGKLLNAITDKNYVETVLPKLKIYKTKQREGLVDRMTDEYCVIGRSLFKKETNLQTFTGLKVQLSTGEEGIIEGGFGQSGKFKVRIPNGLQSETVQMLSALGGKKKGKKAKAESSQEPSAAKDSHEDHQPIKISLRFKRYIYDAKKQMIQK